MADAKTMQIKYEQLRWAGLWTKQYGKSFQAHIVKETLPGDSVQYDAMSIQPPMVVGKDCYWADASGATSCRRYLGFLDVEIIEIPSWVGEEQCES